MLVGVKCSKCGESGALDIGNMTKEDVTKLLEKKDSFQCFGNHVEIGSPLDYWTIDWNDVKGGKAPTEVEFEKGLREKFKKVFSHDELGQYFKVIGFAWGMCMVEDKATGEELAMQFTHSPQGKRFYYI